MSCFIVERDWKGVSTSKPLEKLGQHAAQACQVFFEDVEVPAENLLAREGDGFMIGMKVFDKSRPPVAAAATGVARRALDEAVRYANERHAFGQPLHNFQGVGFMLADMKIRVEAARALEIELGAPLLRITRIVFDERERPVERVVALYRADSYQYHMHLRHTA